MKPYPAGDHNSTSSQHPMQLATLWLKDCLENHPKCNDEHSPSELPTRLIHVGDEETHPRLCSGSSLTPRTPYATLSYCWGTAPALKLTISTLDHFLHDIDPSTLSRTHRDAVEVVRKLGISYIWIDSLCIVQNSPADWRKESGRMANVYRHATINIAATFATDGDGGCFAQRDGSLIQPLILETKWEGTQNKLWEWSLDERGYRTHLDSRAWVIQEAMLSTRKLSFGRR